jgi:predicted amidohydrolase
MKTIAISTVAFFLLLALADAANPSPDGWQTVAPRDEIRPVFSFEPRGGPKNAGSLVITHDHRDGLDGWFQKSFAVSGGDYYRFDAVRKTSSVAVPRRSVVVRVLWQDEAGRTVSADVPEQQIKELGHVPSAEPEYPTDGGTDRQGWTTVAAVYRAHTKATRAVVELHLQWAPNGRVKWSDVQFEKTTPPPPRKVRLATIHYKPMGRSPRENCEEYAPLIVEAAKQKADIVVLRETVPTVGVPQKIFEIAEVIPGPTTGYFGELARNNHLHIVLSLNERDGHLVYNTAVLIGRDGRLIGKYRKVCLPPGEVAAGIAPGKDYPVFDTKLGKVGLMICYDGFFPEVARELSNRGAEIIAWPVYGCNPLLAQARACENHVYLVSSCYMEPKDGWMISAIFDRTGKPIAQAGKRGTVAVAEVDLSQPYVGPYNLGDFRAMLPRHRPVSAPELP